MSADLFLGSPACASPMYAAFCFGGLLIGILQVWKSLDLELKYTYAANLVYLVLAYYLLYICVYCGAELLHVHLGNVQLATLEKRPQSM